jgi:hypothetical protein
MTIEAERDKLWAMVKSRDGWRWAMESHKGGILCWVLYVS